MLVSTVNPDRRPSWLGHFLLLSAIWGLSFLFIKVADRSLPPLLVALGRVLLGAATLLLILLARREGLPRNLRTWGHLAVAAFLLNALPFTLFAYGETQVTSVLAGIWNATTPLLTLLVAMFTLPDEHPTAERALGLAIGFAGVLVVLGAGAGMGGGMLAGSLACLGAAAGYSLGFPYTRRFLAGRAESALSLAAAQLLLASAELVLVAPFVVAAPPGPLTVESVASIAALGALGTGFAYILNYAVIRRAGATIASTVTYVIPIFSTLAGVAVLGERLSWNEPAGAVVVILGVVVAQGRLRSMIRRVAVATPR